MHRWLLTPRTVTRREAPHHLSALATATALSQCTRLLRTYRRIESGGLQIHVRAFLRRGLWHNLFMTSPTFDKQDQFEKIQSGLLANETIIAVYDAIGAGTGFIGVTNRRIILQDNSFVGKKIALTSIPYARVTTVSFVSNKSMLGKFSSSSEIAISVSGHTHEVSFRGDEKAKHVHDVVLWHMLNG